MRRMRKGIRGDVEFAQSIPRRTTLIACLLGQNSPLPLRVPLLPIVPGARNRCSLAEARDESANPSDDSAMAAAVLHDRRGGGESVVRDEWTWYRGRGCEDGRAGRQEDECEDCDGEWFMCLHGEGYLGSGMEPRKFVVVSTLVRSKQQEVQYETG
jgi:hypothetical protein